MAWRNRTTHSRRGLHHNHVKPDRVVESVTHLRDYSGVNHTPLVVDGLIVERILGQLDAQEVILHSRELDLGVIGKGSASPLAGCS